MRPDILIVILSFSGNFSEAEQIAIKQLWRKKYLTGSYDQGIEFSSKRSDEAIHLIRNYLMKDMTTQFGTGYEA
jgi:hypothetical protein